MSEIKVVDEGQVFGVYIWEIDGRPVVDEDYNHLVAPARRGDLRAIKRLTDFVRNELGIFEGGPVFQPGARPISQTEWEEQVARQQAGLVPDEYDLPSLIDDLKYQRELDKQ